MGKPIVVIGAGAAGLMAAIFAAEAAGPRVVLLERTKDGGRKILISGGGRCNVLPSALSPSQYFTASSMNTMRKMLLSWPLAEQRTFFESELRIPLALEPETGKLFPASNRARDVRDALVAYAVRRGVGLQFDASVRDVVPAADFWRVKLADGSAIDAGAVIVATGGLSVPATGSDGTGLRVAERLGHTVHETYAALTPLTAESIPHAALAGVSLTVTLSTPLDKGRYETTGGFLFTHRGYSGPSVLNISHFAVRSRAAGEPQPIFVQWTEFDMDAWDRLLREQGTAQLGTLIRRHLPLRLADILMSEASVAADRTLAELRRDERSRIVQALTRYRLPWTGDEGYRKAEVTGGGVALGEVDPVTLESRKHPHLFFCGELLDAFGPIGGFNFAWAFATGRAAGIGAARVR
jgi:hypothetical protein